METRSPLADGRIPYLRGFPVFSKIIAVLPPGAKIAGMPYMGIADWNPQSRAVEAKMSQLGSWLAETDSEALRGSLEKAG